jgi:hypothetical protein
MDARRHAISSALDAALSGVRDPYARRVIAENLLKALRPRGKRKPPESGLMVPAVPPRGPLPLQGGAEAPLEFDA